MTYTLSTTPREKTGSNAAAKLRAEKKLPAVVYGANKEATPVTLDMAAFEKVWEEAGESAIVNLEGVKGVEGVLIQEVAVDPLYGTPVHVDLLAVDANQEIEATVPLVFDGVAPAEKELGGVLVKVSQEVDVRTLPKDLPHEITIDISSLKTFDDVIRVKDIALPTGVTIVGDAEETVVLVQAQKEEEEAVTDASEVEVEEKGKKEEEGEAAAE
jgi:large subunit ribosomal protein L25